MNTLSLGRIGRYVLALTGPVGNAGAQFLISLQLLHALPVADFGSFSFLLVTSQLGMGIWSALFCAPLPVLLNERDNARQQAMVRCIFTACLGLSIAAAVVFLLIGFMLGMTEAAVLLFAAYVGFAFLRWFARANAYACHQPLRTTGSDLLSTAVLLVGLAAMLYLGTPSLELTFTIFLVSAALSLVPFGRSYFRQQYIDLSLREVHLYHDVWTRHSRWSLIGVITTEATANAHAYIVTLFGGPAAFAGIAASALIARPIAVVMNALTDFERPQFARLAAAGDLRSIWQAMMLFRLALAATWIGTAAAGWLVATYAPSIMFPAQYSHDYILMGIVLWMLISAVRLSRMPDSALLQGAGEFRWLAYASVVSCGFSIAAVGLSFAIAGALWSLLGILLGEAVFAAWIWRQRRRWAADVTPGNAAD